MEIFTISMLLIIGALIYYYFSYRMAHFERLDILHEKSWPIVGHMGPFLFRRQHVSNVIQRMYEKFSDVKYFGFYDFLTPAIMVRDPEIITSISIKNFDSFCDHLGFGDEKLEPLFNSNLFALRGDAWREMRKLLSPVFTSSKMKLMYGLMIDCAETFVDHLARDCKNGKELDMKVILSRFSNDVVASAAFGYSIDSMKDPGNEFYRLGREAATFDSVLSLKFMLAKNFGKLMQLFGIRLFNDSVRLFFQNVVETSVKTREDKGIYRPDLIQLMMETKSKTNTRELSIQEMTGQAFIFFFAGFDTTSVTMCFMMHEIAVNPDVKERLVAEIEDMLKETNGKPTYDSIHRMKYLEAVLNETLRLHPLATFLDRLCVKEYTLPPAAPGKKSITVKPGDSVYFPVCAIHQDPQFYPNPEKFDPDRFLDKQPDPSIFLPFGVGPRFCIGNRFAMMEAKILTIYLLAHCDIEPASRTCIPMEYSKSSFQIQPKTGFWLKVKTRDTSLFDHYHSGRVANGKVSTE